MAPKEDPEQAFSTVVVQQLGCSLSLHDSNVSALAVTF
jgi:hypothetical protein